MMKLLFLLAIAACPASAADYQFTKKVDAGTLQAQIVASGISVAFIDCDNIKNVCTVHGASADPSAVIAAYVYADPATAYQSMLDELAGIEIRLDDGTATAADLRRAIKIILKLNRLNKKP